MHNLKLINVSSFTCSDGTVYPIEIYETEFYYEFHVLQNVYNEELNKSEYKPNDSVYGYVEFSKIETDQFGNVIPHNGKGYFRGKIENYK